jgi:CubicO group peptidase (beta-lactamase class C family)
MIRTILLSTMLLFSTLLPAQEEVASLIEAYLEEAEGFSGAIMVAQNGKPIFMQGYGPIGGDTEGLIDVNTLFDIGSITKPFTATAILTLVDQGKLAVQDPLSTYFPELGSDKAGITIHQLLTHSSGLPSALGDDYAAISREAFVQKMQEAELLFAPGTGYEYSNVGYTLLAMILEDLSGKSYDTYLRENLLYRSKMLMTGYQPQGVEYMPIAHGVQKDGTDLGTPLDQNWDGSEPYWHLKGNGGLLSSASDMFRFYLALREDLFLMGESVKAQFSPHVDEGGGSFYGYGWVVLDGGQHVTHNGGNGIFRADFHWFPQEDLALFAVSNDARVPLFRISEDLVAIARGEEPSLQLDLSVVDLETFPANKRAENAQQFLTLIQDPDPEATAEFITTSFSPGCVERNGAERLAGLFAMIHDDHPGLKLVEVREGGEHMELKTRSAEEDMVVRFLIRFVGDQIDGLDLEAE